MSREVKICEVCGTYNDPSNEECCNDICGEDLSYVLITEIEDEPKKKVEDKPKDEIKSIPVEKVEPTEKKCVNNNKTMVLPQNTLVNKIDGKAIEIPMEGCTIGRSGEIECEYFNQFQFISNIHAHLEYRIDDLVIKDLGSTNGTRVNNEKLAKNEEKILRIGDIVKIANIQFVVE